MRTESLRKVPDGSVTCRRTITREVCCEGRGLHTGTYASVRLSPNRGAHGIHFAFRRGEYAIEEAVPSGTSRGTDLLFPGGVRLKTAEHLLAAVGGLALDSLTIRVGNADGPDASTESEQTRDGDGAVLEIPALDGCSAQWVRLLRDAGIEERDGCSTPLVPPVPVVLSDEEGKRLIAAFPSDDFRIDYVIQYPSIPDIRTQAFSIRTDPETFERELAGARTFALASEIETLRRNGLARGGSLENATVFGEEPGSVQAKGGLRFPDEPVRHKVLDLIGDLVLVGRPVRARIVAFRAGHEMHLRLVHALKALTLRQ